LTSSPPRKTGIPTDPRRGGELGFALPRRHDHIGSTRGHGTPCRDVDCRVHIRVRGKTAGSTPEDRLALACLPVSDTAPRTSLRGAGRRDLLQPTSSLVFQSIHQHPPTARENRTVQAGLRPNVLPWGSRGALGRADHAPNPQVLDSDDIEGTSEGCGDLLDPVLAPISLPGLQLRDSRPERGPTSRSSAGTREPLLQPTKASKFGRPERGADKELTSRQGGGYSHAAIYPDDAAGAWRRDWLRARGEGDMPPVGSVPSDSVRLRRRQHPGHPELDPPDLRDPHPGPLARQPLDTGRLISDDPETLTPASLAPRRSAMGPSEELLHCLVEISQCLLLHRLRPRTQPLVLCAGLGELTRLDDEPRSRRATSGAPHCPLLEGQIPHKPRVRALLEQCISLSWSRRQAVARHAKNSTSTHRHFLEGGRWRATLTTDGETCTPSFR
jgi:hypothetical protein